MNSRSILLVALIGLLPRAGASQTTERLYVEACEAGDLIACNVFGLMYETGDGVPRDLSRAASLYEMACEGGELVGCTNLGLMYAVGAGVTLSVARAAGLYQVACEGGERLACSLRADSERFARSGRVGDAETERPLSQAIVELPELGVRAVSDELGRLQLTDLLPGIHALRVERLGYTVLEGALEVPGSGHFVILLYRSLLNDPSALGRITGRVMEEGVNRGLSDVEITLLRPPQVGTLSDGQGRFTLTGVVPGLVELRFVHLGYAPRTATLIVQPGESVEIAAEMSTQPIELEAIEVTVRSTYLERNGFYDRKIGASGAQFTRDQLSEIDPLLVSHVFRNVPGVIVSYESGDARPVSRRSTSITGGNCELLVYLDGMLMQEWDMDDIRVEWVEAMEVYNGLNTPAQYARDPCGVVLIWTR